MFPVLGIVLTFSVWKMIVKVKKLKFLLRIFAKWWLEVKDSWSMASPWHKTLAPLVLKWVRRSQHPIMYVAELLPGVQRTCVCFRLCNLRIISFHQASTETTLFSQFPLHLPSFLSDSRTLVQRNFRGPMRRISVYTVSWTHKELLIKVYEYGKRRTDVSEDWNTSKGKPHLDPGAPESEPSPCF